MQWFLLGNLKKMQWGMPEVVHRWCGFAIRVSEVFIPELGNKTIFM